MPFFYLFLGVGFLIAGASSIGRDRDAEHCPACGGTGELTRGWAQDVRRRLDCPCQSKRVEAARAAAEAAK